MKKRLLNEDVTRRFMKLANIGPLAESYIDETMYEEEEEDLAGLGGEEDLAGMGDEEGLEGAPEEDPMGVPDEGGELDVEQLVSALVDAIEETVPGAEGMISVEGEAGGEEEMGMEEPGAEEEMPGEEEEPMPGEEEEEVLHEDDIEEDLAAANVSLEENEDSIVNEVTRRVARRLLRASAGR